MAEDIFLFGVIDDMMLNQIQDVINNADQDTKFVAKINSPGGDVYSGMAIYNMFKQKDVDIEISGTAASMASYIAMAGEKISIHENSDIMIHKPWAFESGNSSDMEKKKEELEDLDERMAKTYSRQTGIDEEEIIEMMEEETKLNAEEAREKGFVDEIITIDESAEAKRQLEYYAKVKRINKQGEDMDILKEIKNLFGIDSEDPEEVVEELKDKKEKMESKSEGDEGDQGDKGESPEGKNTDQDGEDIDPEKIQAKIDKLENKMENMEQEKQSQKVERLINGAIDDGKILPGNKEVWMQSAKSDFEGTKEKIENKDKNSAMPKGVEVDDNENDENQSSTEAVADYFKAQGRD